MCSQIQNIVIIINMHACLICMKFGMNVHVHRQILFGNDGSPYNYMYECQDVSVVWSKDVSTHLVQP